MIKDLDAIINKAKGIQSPEIVFGTIDGEDVGQAQPDGKFLIDKDKFDLMGKEDQDVMLAEGRKHIELSKSPKIKTEELKFDPAAQDQFFEEDFRKNLKWWQPNPDTPQTARELMGYEESDGFFNKGDTPGALDESLRFAGTMALGAGRFFAEGINAALQTSFALGLDDAGLMPYNATALDEALSERSAEVDSLLSGMSEFLAPRSKTGQKAAHTVETLIDALASTPAKFWTDLSIIGATGEVPEESPIARRNLGFLGELLMFKLLHKMPEMPKSVKAKSTIDKIRNEKEAAEAKGDVKEAEILAEEEVEAQATLVETIATEAPSELYNLLSGLLKKGEEKPAEATKSPATPEPTDIKRIETPESTAADVPEIIGFTTAKGSTYTIDGQTTTIKS